jgi:hypothetical protein
MLVCASHTVVEDPELKELFETRVGKGPQVIVHLLDTNFL